MKSKIQKEGKIPSKKECDGNLVKSKFGDVFEYHKKVLLYGLKDWSERSAQGLTGEIIKVHGKYKVEVEIPQLPGNSVYFTPVCDVELNDSLLDRQVLGDDGPGGFIIRVLCLDDVIVED